MKSRRKLAAVAGTLVATLVLVLAGTSVANAAVGRAFDVPFAAQHSRLSRTLVAGDCRQIGQNQDPPFHHSFIRLETPDLAGRARFTWDFSMYTTGTIFGDVWHATWVFKRADGVVVLIVRMDGPKMGDEHPLPGRIERGTRTIPVQISFGSYSSITSVDWEGDC